MSSEYVRKNTRTEPHSHTRLRLAHRTRASKPTEKYTSSETHRPTQIAIAAPAAVAQRARRSHTKKSIEKAKRNCLIVFDVFCKFVTSRKWKKKERAKKKKHDTQFHAHYNPRTHR